MFDTRFMGSSEALDVESLQEIAQRVAPTQLAATNIQPVPEPFGQLFSHGGPRWGTTLSFEGNGATSALLAMLSAASQEQKWIGFVGLEALGWSAVEACGIDMARVVSVAEPSQDKWPQVLGALIDSLDIIVIAPRHQVGRGAIKKIAARLRSNGVSLIHLEFPDGRPHLKWGESFDYAIEAVLDDHHGLESGAGYLQRRSIHVSVDARRDMKNKGIVVDFGDPYCSDVDVDANSDSEVATVTPLRLLA